MELGCEASQIETDVLIAGGGPAGAAAAMTCRAAGLSVALAHPPKSLAETSRAWETLHPDALSLLDLLNAREAVSRASIAQLHSFKVGRHRRRLSPSSRPGRHIDRVRFDSLLLARAAIEGVRMLPSTLVDGCRSGNGISAVLSNGTTVQAHWLIDATGRRRIGSRLFPARYRRLSPALISRTALSEADIGRARGTEFCAHSWGWTWVTGAHRDRRTWTAVQAAGDEPAEAVRQLLVSSVAGSVHTTGATWFRIEPDEIAPVLPVGDAAGAIDPASGSGVTNALASGLAAGKTIALCLLQRLPSDRCSARYQEWWCDRLEGQASMLRSLYEENGIGLV